MEVTQCALQCLTVSKDATLLFPPEHIHSIKSPKAVTNPSYRNVTLQKCLLMDENLHPSLIILKPNVSKSNMIL